MDHLGHNRARLDGDSGSDIGQCYVWHERSSFGFTENLTRETAHAFGYQVSRSRFGPCYLLRVPRFVRVANRHGWKIEAVGSAGAVESKTLGSRDEALAYAASLEPHWIEIGDSGFVKEHVDQRLSEVRVREAVGTGAEMLAVCCPFEVSLFEDA
ncbi:MAG: hypothetical protein WCC30_08115, partial [Candidatus Dormiibacterota bacterium]